jgi:hypothetical protein
MRAVATVDTMAVEWYSISNFYLSTRAKGIVERFGLELRRKRRKRIVVLVPCSRVGTYEIEVNSRIGNARTSKEVMMLHSAVHVRGLLRMIMGSSSSSRCAVFLVS